MHDAPSNGELVAAVKHFLDTVAAPQLTGHAAFHARVASNALATVMRDLERRPSADAAAAIRLQNLIGPQPGASLDQMNVQLCAAVRDGRIGLTTPGLLAHLKLTTIDQLTVDQPNYSGLATARRSRL
jgi:Domain of unknown function (DUF6285)